MCPSFVVSIHAASGIQCYVGLWDEKEEQNCTDTNTCVRIWYGVGESVRHVGLKFNRSKTAKQTISYCAYLLPLEKLFCYWVRDYLSVERSFQVCKIARLSNSLIITTNYFFILNSFAGVYYRDCGVKDMGTVCHWHMNDYNISNEFCHCERDFCNAASSIKALPSLTFILLAALYFKSE